MTTNKPVKPIPTIDNTGLPWWQRTACKDQTDLFVGPESEGKSQKALRESIAKAICQRCAVRVERLNEASRNDEMGGVWVN